jgi:ribA/ribD-fused uncharacterized protein
MEILIKRVKDEYGWLSNMYPSPLTYKDRLYPTCEHLFQCLRFPNNPEIQDHIRIQISPMTAKMVAKAHKDLAVGVGSDTDLYNMRMCINLKLLNYPEILKKLIDTGDSIIIEDCSARDNVSGRFWGMVKVGKIWEGENWLGRIWMEIRKLYSPVFQKKEE